MAIEFRGVRFPPLRDLTVSAPSGAVIGIIGEKGAGKGVLLRLASGLILFCRSVPILKSGNYSCRETGT